MFNEQIYIRTDAEPIMISKTIGFIPTHSLPIEEQKRLNSLYEDMFVNMINQIKALPRTVILQYKDTVLHIYKDTLNYKTAFTLTNSVNKDLYLLFTVDYLGKVKFKVLDNDLKHFIKLADFAREGLI